MARVRLLKPLPRNVLGTGQLARRWGVHRNTIYNWIDSGLLKAKRYDCRRYGVHKKVFQEFETTFGLKVCA